MTPEIVYQNRWLKQEIIFINNVYILRVFHFNLKTKTHTQIPEILCYCYQNKIISFIFIAKKELGQCCNVWAKDFSLNIDLLIGVPFFLSGINHTHFALSKIPYFCFFKMK